MGQSGRYARQSGVRVWYTLGMAQTNRPKHVRRQIMAVLYESYQRDPMQMLTPSDIADAGALLIDELAPNCHYLHDRQLIELMMGYNPPLFAAARIAPEGIDLYEDRQRFERYFNAGPSAEAAGTAQVIPAVMALAEQAEHLPLEGLRREWLLRDVSRLRDLLRQPERDWDAESILNALQWIEGVVTPESDLSALGDLKRILERRFE